MSVHERTYYNNRILQNKILIKDGHFTKNGHGRSWMVMKRQFSKDAYGRSLIDQFCKDDHIRSLKVILVWTLMDAQFLYGCSWAVMYAHFIKDGHGRWSDV
jgi:hypothetical protein